MKLTWTERGYVLLAAITLASLIWILAMAGCARKSEPTQTNAIKVPANGTAVVTIKHNGEVIYDTNNVSGATAFFWKTLSELIARQR